MSTTSMSLESLSFLLQHMDANRRFEIRQRCPSLREFEKSVPLKINFMLLTQSSVTVNHTTYRIGCIQKCKVGEAPRYVAERNETGGVPHDVDEYGLNDDSDALPVTPGDVVLSQHEEQFMPDEFPHVGALENFVPFLEGELAELRGRRPSRVLAPILEGSSFPLKYLDIEILSDEDTTNTMVKTAESLRIRDILTDDPQALSSITNPVVRISMHTQPEHDIERLVRNWIESQRPVGHKYIFDFCSEPHFPNEIEDMAKELNGVIIDDENLIIPMSDATELKMSYGPFPDFAPYSNWAVKFSTEKIEHG
ncbi:unnamed protein product [Caenorhabditis brenneri]